MNKLNTISKEYESQYINKVCFNLKLSMGLPKKDQESMQKDFANKMNKKLDSMYPNLTEDERSVIYSILVKKAVSIVMYEANLITKYTESYLQ